MSDLAVFGGMDPQEVRAPTPPPSLGQSQQQSCLKKMLVMATAPANSGQTGAPQLSPRLGAPAVLGRSGNLRDARLPAGPAALPGRARRPAVSYFNKKEATLLLRWNL